MKRLAVILSALILSLTLCAQVGEARNDLAVGVTGGAVLNRVSFNPTIKQSWMTGMTGGFLVRYTCEKYLSALCALQAEVLYSQMGWRELIEVSEDTYSRRMDYVQIPFLASLGFGRERGGVKGFLALGPQIGFVLGESEKRGGAWTEPLVRPNNVTMQYGKAVERKFEYGLTGGLGMEVSTRSGHRFLLEGRYFFALSDIFRNSKKDPFGRSANGAIMARLSYLFDVIKTKDKSLIPSPESVPEPIPDPSMMKRGEEDEESGL